MDQIPDLLNHLLVAHISSRRCIGISTLNDRNEPINPVQTLIKVYLGLLLLLVKTSRLCTTGSLGELPLNLFFATLEMRPEHLQLFVLLFRPLVLSERVDRFVLVIIVEESHGIIFFLFDDGLDGAHPVDHRKELSFDLGECLTRIRLIWVPICFCIVPWGQNVEKVRDRFHNCRRSALLHIC